ncbi:hypothetical protein MMC21_000481 [Puttea exsequens]|nr:hypothetical protein [Puttea exsequens]
MSHTEPPISDPTPSQPLDNERIDLVPMRTHATGIYSDDPIALGPTLPQDITATLSEGGFAALRTRGVKRTLELILAVDRRPAPSPSSMKLRTHEDSDVDSTWTRKRLRSSSVRAVGSLEGHSPKAQTESVKKRKTTEVPRRSTGSKPVFAAINQIGQTDKLADIQATIQELKQKLSLPRISPQSLRGRISMQIDAPPARIIQALPDLAGEIENSVIDEWLSRLHNRMALADFHSAYRTAQAKPEEFLQELDRNPLGHTHQLRARNGTKCAEVKERFIELVFCQSKSKRNWKKD